MMLDVLRILCLLLTPNGVPLGLAIHMVTWRAMRMLFFLPLLMLGLLVCAAYVMWGYLFGGQPLAAATVVQSPEVAEPVSIGRPLVNPVLRIDVPGKSFFSP